MMKLIWTVAALTLQGPVVAEVPETTTFEDRAKCVAFGERMSPRMADWTRGVLRADWDQEIGVRFRCEAHGVNS